MDNKDDIKKELEENSPLLSSLKKGNPYRVPENYFEEFPNELQRKIVAASANNEQRITNNSKVRKLTVLNYFAFAAAASILIFFSLYFLNPAHQAKEITPVQATKEEIKKANQDFLLAQFSEEEIIELIAENASKKHTAKLESKKPKSRYNVEFKLTPAQADTLQQMLIDDESDELLIDEL